MLFQLEQWHPFYSDDKNGCVFRYKVPGFKKEEIKVEQVGDYIITSGSSERWGDFERQVLIPQTYDILKANAKLEDGVLTITVPVRERFKIEIQ